MMRTVLAVVVPVVLLGASAAVFSAQWVHIGSDARGNHWHLNVDSIVQEAHRVTAWKRIEFRAPYPRADNGLPLRWAYVLNVVDCHARHVHVKALSLHEPDGSVAAMQEDGSAEMRWPAGTRVPLLERAIEMVCGAGR